MVTLTSRGKHCAKRRTLRECLSAPVVNGIRRYHASRKPVHFMVTGGIFVVEIGAVIFHVEIIYHIVISTSVLCWESAVTWLTE